MTSIWHSRLATRAIVVAEYYQIFVRPKAGVTRSQIEKQLDRALDWYRYADNCWVVYTSVDAKKWKERLAPVVKPDGYMFICKLDISERNGWMPKEFWEWIRTPK